jgi:hypothetical protein
MAAYASPSSPTGFPSAVATTPTNTTIHHRSNPVVVFGVLSTVIGVGALILTASILKLTYLAHRRAVNHNRYVISSNHTGDEGLHCIYNGESLSHYLLQSPFLYFADALCSCSANTTVPRFDRICADHITGHKRSVVPSLSPKVNRWSRTIRMEARCGYRYAELRYSNRKIGACPRREECFGCHIWRIQLHALPLAA